MDKMKSLFLLLKILCAWITYGIGAESSYPISPCPDVFSYESFNPNNDHWFGVILISTDEVLDGIRLGIRFDRPVDLLVSWTGEVTTTNNEQFTILNLNKRLQPGDHVYSSRFRVKFNKSRGGVPQLKNVHLNGRQICSADSNTGGKIVGATRRPDPVFGFESPSITNNYENYNTRTTTGSNLFTYTEAEYYRPTSKRPQEQYNNKPQTFESGGDIERPYVRPTHNNNGELEGNHNQYNNGGSDIYGNYNHESTTTYPKTSSVPSRPVYYGQENPSYSNSNNNNNNYNNNESTTKKSSTSNSQKQQSSSSSSSNTSSSSSSSNGNKKNPKQPPKTSNSNHSSTSTSSNNSNRYTTTTERNSYVKTTPKQSWSSSQTSYNNTRDVPTVGGHANPVMSRPDESNNVYHHTNSHTDNGKRGQSTTTSNYNGLSDETGSRTYECGKVDDDVVRDQAVTLIVMGENTVRGQWPWHVALYRAGINLNLEYICGGTLVDLQTVITAAHCTAKNGMNRPVDPDTLVVYLGKYHSLQYSDELVHSGLQSRQVREIHINPGYNNTNFLGDISVLKLSSPVQYTKYVRPCCLWRFQQSVIGKEGIVVGWGINEKGVTPDELKMAKMPVVSNEQCLNSNQPFFSMFTAPGMTFCAGYRAGTTVCNGDSGGGMVFNQNSRWYLRGSVSLAVARQGLRICDTNHYVIFTDVVKYLDWIDQFLT